MALFKTIADIQKYLSIDTNSKYEQILPYIKQAESQILIPALSKAEYDSLHSAYQAVSDETTLTTAQKNLLDKCRLVVAPFGLMFWTPIGQLRIDANGIRIVNTDTHKTAFQWQIEDAKKALADMGYQAVEDLLVFLEENKATYTSWAASANYAELNKLVISSATEFEKYFPINNSRRTFIALKSAIKKAEDFYMKSYLGEDLFDEVKGELEDNDLSADNEALMPYLRPAIAHMAVQMGITEHMLAITPEGVITPVSFAQQLKAFMPADVAKLDALKNRAEQHGLKYLTDLKNYLNKNASATKYAVYFDSDLYTDPDEDDGIDNPSDAGVAFW